MISAAARHDGWYVRLYAAVLAKDSNNKTLIADMIPQLADPSKLVQASAH